MKTQKLLYIVTRAPYSTALGQEALDAALIGAGFEQQCSVLFIQDGVFQLKTDQYVGDTGLKQYTKTFKALQDFGVENIYVDELSMLARGVSDDELIIAAERIDSVAVTSLIAEQYRVLTF